MIVLLLLQNGHLLESRLNRYVGYSTGEKEGKEDECFIERTYLKKKVKISERNVRGRRIRAYVVW